MSNDFPLWKTSLLSRWEEIGVEAVLERAGLNFHTDFVEALRVYPGQKDPYANHEWSVFQFPRLVSGVVHAAPKYIGTGEKVLWEEWYFEDGDSHHNVLRNHEHAEQEKHVRLDDDEHPAIVINTDWYYRDDLNRRPILLR